MNSTKSPQKKKIITTTIYAVIIGLLVIACAIVIAMVSAKQTTNNVADVGGGEESDITVSTPTYFVPMKGAVLLKDYSKTEYQFNDTMKHWEIHKAIDLKVGESADVMAIADGTVSEIYTTNLDGTVIKIAHANGLVSIYKSLDSKVNVKVGDRVSGGSVIGTATDSMQYELNSGAHLHLETVLNGVKVDPNDYISLGDK